MLKKIHYNSPVILTFTCLAFLVFILGELTNSKSTIFLFSIYRTSIKDPLFYIRLFTHILGHINWEHFINNFLLILLIGPILEEKYGSYNILFMILFTAFITGIINVMFFNTALLGASGIVFMFILLSSFTNIQKGTIPLTLILVIVIFIGREIMEGLFSKDQISQLTHIIGGFCGGVFGYLKSKYL
ncbi:rhomboid family intramembrane serine protease [Defluviitalea phaphyphila]|uniref:rhomboid family intramembrane serine protease n=1 Tax=Defluviitalea phaphyphila TaxID=1473580 RepID=UPI0007301D20|nr:rhomboid family intramembrane serine protease [Defluviitalea phaphyphila]